MRGKGMLRFRALYASFCVRIKGAQGGHMPVSGAGTDSSHPRTGKHYLITWLITLITRLSTE